MHNYYKILILLLLSYSTMADSLTEFDYIDGNNNIYHISPKLLEYQPITPDQSSSGIYSGGHAVKKHLNNEDYQLLINAVQTALNNHAIHIEQRLMGSAMIVYNNKKTTVLLKHDAKETQALDLFLKTLR